MWCLWGLQLALYTQFMEQKPNSQVMVLWEIETLVYKKIEGV
jgi:hypothetical protein